MSIINHSRTIVKYKYLLKEKYTNECMNEWLYPEDILFCFEQWRSEAKLEWVWQVFGVGEGKKQYNYLFWKVMSSWNTFICLLTSSLQAKREVEKKLEVIGKAGGDIDLELVHIEFHY